MTSKPGFWKIFFLTSVITTQSVGAQTCNSLDNFEIFLGNWQEMKEDQTTHEVWYKVSSKTIEGSASVSDKFGNLTSSESLRIVELSNQVFYIAKVNENTLPIAFKLVRCEENRFEFENPQHDFPKKISYMFKSPTTLLVHVSGKDGDGFEINFQKLR